MANAVKELDQLWVKQASGLYLPFHEITGWSSAAVGDYLAKGTGDTLAMVSAVTGSGASTGTGSPEGAVTAAVGAFYIQTDASPASDGVWYKQSGAGDTGWVQVTASDGSGSGSSLPSPDDPPASPHTEDDEFDNATLDAKWTETLTGATADVDTTIPSHYVVKVTGNQSAKLSQSFAPGADFSVTMAVSAALAGNNMFMDLDAMDDVSFTNGFGLRLWSGTVQFLTRTSGSTTLSTSLTRSRATRNYLHIQRVGTTISVWWGTDGRAFTRVASATKTFTMGQIIMQYVSSGDTTPHRIGIDWIRRDWITL